LYNLIENGRDQMEDIFKGRVAIITGAGNGLGRAHATALAQRGARVVVNDIGTSPDGFGVSREVADIVVKKIKDAGGTAVASYDSVATEEGAKRLIQLAVDQFGRLDILVNNAGIIRSSVVDEIKTEDWDAVIKTHLYGTFYCTRSACAIMKKQVYGRIINTSSAVGFGLINHAAYSAAKEGITGFSRTVARDMAKYGITCNVIRPVAAWRGVKQVLDSVDVNQPVDISPLVLYLASEQAGNVNGCIFEVWRGHVGIFVDPPPVEQVVWKDGQWSPEELIKFMPETLTRGRSREDLPHTMPFFMQQIEK
jgi:NAD(P)-dependent dehydrogenase (short-subunit alcohol dehydrogenase family)